MKQHFDVAIIGAGAAGVAAAREIFKTGRSVILIEASQRVGGRAWTQTLAGMPLDLGCGWLHSAERNPLVALAEANGFSVLRGPTAWREQYRDLGFPPEDQDAANAAFEAFMHRLEHDPPASDCAADALKPGSPWNAYLEALSGYINGASLAQLSVADYLAYDQAASENNWRLPRGYGTLIAALLPPIPLKLGTPVTRIDRGDNRLRLETPLGALSASTAILTVPPTVLASGRISFTPAIDDHCQAAARLPLGLADKIFLALREGHGLESETHLLGNPSSRCTGSYYIRPMGRPVIECFLGGSGAEALEREGLDAAFSLAVEELARLLGSNIRPHLYFLTGTAWRKTDWIEGSYSYALPGHSSSRGVLAAAVDDRLFFAGEATHSTDYSTAHGAWESGVRAAAEALASDVLQAK